MLKLIVGKEGAMTTEDEHNTVTTSMRRQHVASTLICLLKNVLCVLDFATNCFCFATLLLNGDIYIYIYYLYFP